LSESLGGAARARSSVKPLPGKQVPALIVSPSSRDKQTLERILQEDARWRVFCADTTERALAALRFEAIPLVLFDTSVPTPDWHAAIRTLLSVSHPVCLLLVSPLVDYALWEELVQLGGFDVLPKPFDKDKVLRTLNFAVEHWHGGWIRRSFESAA